MRKFLIEGNITADANVNAIVTLINPAGMWFGGVDKAIKRLAGDYYHKLPGRLLTTAGLSNGQAVVATGYRSLHGGSFDDVVFVVDALTSPLRELLLIALKQAKTEGYTSIAIPMMRTGVMLGLVEPTLNAVLEELQLGFELAEAEGCDLDVYIVVYNDPESLKKMHMQLNIATQV